MYVFIFTTPTKVIIRFFSFMLIMIANVGRK